MLLNLQEPAQQEQESGLHPLRGDANNESFSAPCVVRGGWVCLILGFALSATLWILALSSMEWGSAGPLQCPSGRAEAILIFSPYTVKIGQVEPTTQNLEWTSHPMVDNCSVSVENQESLTFEGCPAFKRWRVGLTLTPFFALATPFSLCLHAAYLVARPSLRKYASTWQGDKGLEYGLLLISLPCLFTVVTATFTLQGFYKVVEQGLSCSNSGSATLHPISVDGRGSAWSLVALIFQVFLTLLYGCTSWWLVRYSRRRRRNEMMI